MDEEEWQEPLRHFDLWVVWTKCVRNRNQQPATGDQQGRGSGTIRGDSWQLIRGPVGSQGPAGGGGCREGGGGQQEVSPWLEFTLMKWAWCHHTGQGSSPHYTHNVTYTHPRLIKWQQRTRQDFNNTRFTAQAICLIWYPSPLTYVAMCS